MKTFIFGGSGFAKEVEWLIHEINKNLSDSIDVQSFVIADDEYSENLLINDIEVISESIYFEKYHTAEKHNCILAIGSPVIRNKIISKITSDNTVFPNLIHPNVCYDKRNVKFGQGVIICAGVIMTTNITIGDFVHLNLDSTIGHDSFVGDYTTISPGVHISGNVKVNQNNFIGTGVVILENISLEPNTIVGAGSVVIKSLIESGTYVGVPAKKVK